MNPKQLLSLVALLVTGIIAFVAVVCGMHGIWPWIRVHQDRDIITTINMAHHVTIYPGSPSISTGSIRFHSLNNTGKASQTMIDFRSNLMVHKQLRSSSRPSYSVEIVDSDEPMTNPHAYRYYPDTGELGHDHEWVFISNAFRLHMNAWGAP